MKAVALLSWRTLAEIAMSNNSNWLHWLARRQATSSLLVSQFSLIKASRFVQIKLNKGPINPNGLLERFIKRHFAPQSIITPKNVSSDLYNRLAARYGEDDIELLAICIAIQNRYEYICWNIDELKSIHLLAPELASKHFEVDLDGI